MSGLVKAKKYDWKDSNLALFGSDTEREVKKESAETEPAWAGAGQEVGLRIWRIVKFEVTEWPKEDYGTFFEGDSYIILNTYKNEGEDELKYDVHFWIGKYSTQDEYGTAAYKTVELDTLLDDAAVQHREVQHHESPMFKSYFNTIRYQKGGADSGFNHVKPEEYTPRLFHFSGVKRNVEVKEIARCRNKISSNDVYILDLGLQLYTYLGNKCSKDEKFKAAQYGAQLKGERGKAELTVLEEDETSEQHAFFQNLDQEEDEDDVDGAEPEDIKKLFRLTIDDPERVGEWEMVKEEGVTQDDLKDEDVFILDSGKHCFVWLGQGASPNEKRNGLSYAQKYLQTTDHFCAAVTVVRSGHETTDFHTAMAA